MTWVSAKCVINQTVLNLKKGFYNAENDSIILEVWLKADEQNSLKVCKSWFY